MRLVLAALILALLVPPAADAAPACGSRECKILLSPGPFADPGAGMKRAWVEARRVAEAIGLKVKESGEGPEPERFVAFLDTKAFDLRKRGYLLRVRREKGFGRKALEGRKGELTFKFRSPSAAAAAAAPVAPAPGVAGETSLEEDASYGVSGVRVVYSRGAGVECDDLPPCTVGGFSRLFTGIDRLGLPGSAPLGRVRGVAIRERRLKPGKVDFGSRKGKVTLSVWLDAPTGRPLVAEFSFTLDLDGSVESLAASRAADRFARALAERFRPILATGFTKTGIVYGDEAPADE